MLPQENTKKPSGFSTTDHWQYFWKQISKQTLFYMPEWKYNNLKVSQLKIWFLTTFKFRLGTAEAPVTNVTCGHPDWWRHILWAQILGNVLEHYSSFPVLHT